MTRIFKLLAPIFIMIMTGGLVAVVTAEFDSPWPGIITGVLALSAGVLAFAILFRGEE